MASHSVEVATVQRSGFVDVYAVMPTMPPINGMPIMPQFLPPSPIPDDAVPKTAEQVHTLQHVARIQYTDTVRSRSEADATTNTSTNKPACKISTRFKLLKFIGLIVVISSIIGLFVSIRVFRPRG